MDKKIFAAEEPCERLDVFVASALGVTRSAAKKLIEEGNVLLCGAPAKASHAVAAGDEVRANIPFAYTDGGAQVSVSMYDGENIISGYTLDGVLPVWNS